MMRAHGYDPVVCPADVEENIPDHSSIFQVPMYLALKKALWVYDRHKSEDSIIISADTIVYKGDPFGDGEIMGKPADFSEGFRMLTDLRNDEHLVITGVCMIDTGSGIKRVFSDTTRVVFGDYSDEELTDYLNTAEAYDKAGGYAIQGTFGKYVKEFDGSYDNVIGFPWELIQKYLLLLQEV